MGGPPFVLVVEDEPALADAWERLLEMSGDYRVELVHRGEAALERLDDEPDVVVLDRNLGAVSGDDILAAIHDRELECGVVVTSGIDRGDLPLEYAVDAYLVKPVSTAALRDAVERLLGTA